MTELEFWPPSNLLIVSGFAGSGKSTFIEQLRKDLLPEAIRNALPSGAGNWTEVSATRARAVAVKNRWKAIEDDRSSAILHYPIDQLQRGEVRPYITDPVLAVLPRTDRVVAIVLCVSRRRLVSQFCGRLAVKARKRAWHSSLVHNVIRAPARTLRARLWRRDILPPDPSLYEDVEWFKGCFSRWNGFLRVVLADKPHSSVLYIEPSTAGREPSFSLLAPPPCMDALAES